MGKYAHPDVLDGLGAVVKANCSRMVACSSTPANFAAVAAATLAETAMASGDFTAGAYASTGRQLTVAAKSGVPVTASGTFDVVALVDDTNSKLLYVTEGTNQSLTSGNTCNFPAFAICKVDQPT